MEARSRELENVTDESDHWRQEFERIRLENNKKTRRLQKLEETCKSMREKEEEYEHSKSVYENSKSINHEVEEELAKKVA